MKKNEESIVSAKLQKVVQTLISEEYFAYQLYLFSSLAVCKEDRGVVADLFNEIMTDELDDHMKSLIEWCVEYNVDVPCSEAEFKRLAATKISRQVSQLKKNKDAGYYIDEAVKSEELAIASYKEALEEDEVSQFTDLQSILWNIYYDEAEHLQNINSAKIAYEAGDSLVIG